jgi:uncharacterized membrane protein
MDIKRIGKHLMLNRARIRRAIRPGAFERIEDAIRKSEATHSGQLRFAIEGALEMAPLLGNQPARERAIDVFSMLRVWDTAQNNGVLIYLLLADRDFEIVADRGIDSKVGYSEWKRICTTMEAEFRGYDFERGILLGIAAVTEHLARHFPASGARRNELPDEPVVM